MVVGVIIECSVGLILIAIGILIWAKQKISLLHEYHYKNVKEDDIPAYTKLIGIGLILIGTGICITGVLNLFYSPLWWAALFSGIVLGIIVIIMAQKKYNGSLFS